MGGIEIYRNIYIKEQQWINRLMDVEFRGRDILLKQFAFISLKFKIEGEIEPYPYLVRVPVEMRAFQTSTAPIVFLLHVVNGVIDELEIITADLTQIDADSIKLEKVEYEVNQEVVVKK